MYKTKRIDLFFFKFYVFYFSDIKKSTKCVYFNAMVVLIFLFSLYVKFILYFKKINLFQTK